MNTYPGFQDAYVSTLRDLRDTGFRSGGVTDPTSIGSHFGQGARSTREKLAYSYSVGDTRRRLIHSRTRRLKGKFLAANFLWTIAGGHELPMIEFYNNKARAFARDAAYFEASFGSRLFSPGHQLRLAERRLKADRASRRASAMIYLGEDSVVDRLDVPCAIALQFFIRDDKLTCITLMRSQSAAMVMPYDIFLFSMLQELLALRLGVEPGPYMHFAASMHYYEDESHIVGSILSESPSDPIPMPRMLNADDGVLERLVSVEQSIRHSHLNNGAMPNLRSSGLDAYWQEFLAPLVEADRDYCEVGFWHVV